jgi:hypothetical protein
MGEHASYTDEEISQLGDLAPQLAGLLRICHRLEEYLEHHNRPAVLKTHRLAASKPIVRDRAGHADLSIGVFNPTGMTVYLGIGGYPAKPAVETPSLSPRSALILPVSGLDFELGADPNDPLLAAGDAIIYSLRFATVQPFFFGGV